MGLNKYLDSIYWRPVFINGIDTGYKISNMGILRNKNEIIEEPYIHIGKKVFKVDKLYLQALAFMDNKYEEESVRDWGRVEWWTNKELIKQAIDIEKEFWDNRKPMGGTEEERVRYACELLQNPEFRLVFIPNITGISKQDMYDLWMGNKWNEISREYIFPVRNYSYGDPRYTNGQIHEVCKMLSQEKSFRHILIQRMTGVNPYTIDLVRFRKSYQYISMFYEFCHREIDHNHGHDLGIYTNQQIRHACFMLEDPSYTYKYISEFCNINMDVLYKIRDKKVLTNLSKDFDTQTARLTDNKIPTTPRIIELLHQGIPNKEIVSRIQIEFKIPDKRKVQLMVGDVKHRYFNVFSSTTIPDDEDEVVDRSHPIWD